MGATNALIDRRRTPLRRATLLRMAEIYAERFADADGRMRATFEIVWLSGWAPHPSQQQPLGPARRKRGSPTRSARARFRRARRRAVDFVIPGRGHWPRARIHSRSVVMDSGSRRFGLLGWMTQRVTSAPMRRWCRSRFTAVPDSTTVPTIAMETPEAISAYSIAVAPLSSRRKRRSKMTGRWG